MRLRDKAMTVPAVDQTVTPYLDALVDHANSSAGRFNVPGHQAGEYASERLVAAVGQQALRLDIPPLVHGVDTGLSPTPYEEAQRLAADAWGAQRTWFVVNGASHANQAVLLTLAQLGEQVVVQRNVHSSTMEGLVISGIRPSFVAPEVDDELGVAHCVTPRALDAALAETPDAIAAIIVSPTYFGTTADVAALLKVARRRGVILVVDEAWGAHFAFHPGLPADALSAGADLVVSSTHKMLTSLTQSAMLHLGPHTDSRLDPKIVDRAVTLLESTSPNALLAGSLDAARHRAVIDGQRDFGAALPILDALRDRISALGLPVLDDRHIGRFGISGVDPLRLTIDVRPSGLTGPQFATRLRELADIYIELSSVHVIMAVFGAGDSLPDRTAAFENGVRAVLDSARGNGESRSAGLVPPPWGRLALSPREAFLRPHDVVPIAAAAGHICAECLAVYPPGIPNVVPGERLTVEMTEYLTTAVGDGAFVRGAMDRSLETLRIVRTGPTT
jgi:arginine decarboxylase